MSVSRPCTNRCYTAYGTHLALEVYGNRLTLGGRNTAKRLSTRGGTCDESLNRHSNCPGNGVCCCTQAASADDDVYLPTIANQDMAFSAAGSSVDFAMSEPRLWDIYENGGQPGTPVQCGHDGRVQVDVFKAGGDTGPECAAGRCHGACGPVSGRPGDGRDTGHRVRRPAWAGHLCPARLGRGQAGGRSGGRRSQQRHGICQRAIPAASTTSSCSGGCTAATMQDARRWCRVGRVGGS